MVFQSLKHCIMTDNKRCNARKSLYQNLKFSPRFRFLVFEKDVRNRSVCECVPSAVVPFHAEEVRGVCVEREKLLLNSFFFLLFISFLLPSEFTVFSLSLSFSLSRRRVNRLQCAIASRGPDISGHTDIDFTLPSRGREGEEGGRCVEMEMASSVLCIRSPHTPQPITSSLLPSFLGCSYDSSSSSPSPSPSFPSPLSPSSSPLYPLPSDTQNPVLMWNGEIFGGVDVGERNDGQV